MLVWSPRHKKYEHPREDQYSLLEFIPELQLGIVHELCLVVKVQGEVEHEGQNSHQQVVQDIIDEKETI